MLSPQELKTLIVDPKYIVSELNKYIVGQHDAKRILALMFVNRSLLRLHHAGQIELSTPLQKTNVLLIGPTGTGKTGLIKALSEISDVPISINDVSCITAAGYIGGKAEDILAKHAMNIVSYVATEYPDLLSGPRFKKVDELVHTGIVYIDEIDKICSRGSSTDINGDMVQNELLKFLDGSEISMSNARSNQRITEYFPKIDTTNILFICGGAFSGLEDIIAKRTSKGGIGFNAEPKNTVKDKGDLLKLVTTDDLKEYGFKAEFLGRLPLKAVLEPLSAEMLERIIYEPKNSLLNQYQAVFGAFGLKVKLTKGSILEMSEIAADLHIGARALKPIFSKLFEDHLFNLWSIKEGKTITIHRSDVKNIRDKV